MKYNLNFDTSDLTFLTTANKSYLNFIKPFIKFCQESNPGCKIEIWVDDLKKVSKTSQNVIIHQLPPQHHVATFRYLTEPKNKTPYTYITDIDIMHTELVQPFHLVQMQKTGLPFSNIRRDKKGRTNRLSGLHFVQTDLWYQQTKNVRNNIDIKGHDEQMLFEIASTVFNINQVPDGLANRPVHGIHCSTEGKPRDPYSKLGWEITSQKLSFFSNIIKKYGTFNEYFEKQVCEPLLGRK